MECEIQIKLISDEHPDGVIVWLFDEGFVPRVGEYIVLNGSSYKVNNMCSFMMPYNKAPYKVIKKFKIEAILEYREPHPLATW